MRSSYLIITTLFACSLLSAAFAADLADPLKTPPERGFVSSQPADRWQKALISGNGAMGALIMSKPLNETITFSHEMLFMPSEPDLKVVKMAPHLDTVRKMIDEGQYREASLFVCGLAEEQGYLGMHWTDPLVPALDLKVSMKPAGDTKDYARSVDFQTGVATVRWEDDRGLIVRRLFVSRADNVAVLSIQSEKAGAVDCRISLATTEGADEFEGTVYEYEDGTLFEPGVDVAIAADGPAITYRSRFTATRPNSMIGHEGALRVVARGGSIDTGDDAVTVTGADEVIVLLGLEVLGQGSSPMLDGLQGRLAGLEADFEALLERHAKIHGGIFNRTRLNIGGGDDHKLTSEELLEKSGLGKLNRALLEKEFDAARYAVLSATGDRPPTLQGVWSGDWTPAWQGDYTQNGNVPSAVASMLMANMPECMEAYIGYIESMVPDFRTNAKELYGCRGIMLPSRTSAHGLNIHFNEEYIHLFWTPGAAWASHFFYDYYLYTGDREFLEKRALPFMKEAALFFEDFLFEGPDGMYVFSPSYSPENTPRNSNSQACINATMDIAIVKELLTNLIAACEELGTESDGVKRWKAMLKKMPPYRINEEGTVEEWSTPKLLDNHRHRHISQLYALFDGLPDEIAENKELQKAFKKVIDDRMGPRREQGGGDMSFGLVQLGQSATSLHEPELAYEIVDMLANIYWWPNMVSTHNPGSIFNVDICGGMPSVIIKMLMNAKPGSLELMPALPAQWPTGSIEGILCRGQIAIKRMDWDGKVIEAVLRSGKKQQVRLSVPGGIAEAEVASGSANVSELDGGAYALNLPEGEAVTLRLVRQ